MTILMHRKRKDQWTHVKSSIPAHISHIRKTEQERWFAVIRLKSYLIADSPCRIRHTSFSPSFDWGNVRFWLLYQCKTANWVWLREDTRWFVALDKLSCNWNDDTLITGLPNKFHCSFVVDFVSKSMILRSARNFGKQKRYSSLTLLTTWKTEIIPLTDLSVISSVS